MEFDKSRVYTVLNADELRAGDKVIMADSLDFLRQEVEGGSISVLKGVLDDSHMRRFRATAEVEWALAYLVERKENCTNCVYEGSAGCSVVEICGENKLTHRCSMYKAKDTKRNLCNSCKHSFAECSATNDDIVFGDGVGKDSVCECDKYEQKVEHDCKSCSYKNCGFKDFNEKNECDRWEAEQKTEQKAEKHTDYNHCEEARKAYAHAMTNVCPEKHYRSFKDTNELIEVWYAKIGMVRCFQTGGALTMPYIWVKYKYNENSKGSLIINFSDNCVSLEKDEDIMTMYDLFINYTFLDGAPCGVEE